MDWWNSIWLLTIMQYVHGSNTILPKFYGEDSAVIVDANRRPSPPNKWNPNLYYNFPVYKLIKPIIPTTTPPPVRGYPSDLITIARNKLGIKRIKDLPSIEELGQLLGTSSTDQTINYIRTLASNDQGIALLKAYLESADYGQDEADDNDDTDADDEDDQDDDDGNATNNSADDVVTPLATPAPESDKSFLQQVGNFFYHYKLWPQSNKEINPSSSSPPLPATNNMAFKPIFVAPQPGAFPMRPLLVRPPLPYHFPIPLRSLPVQKATKSTPSPKGQQKLPKWPENLQIPKEEQRTRLENQLKLREQELLLGEQKKPELEQQEPLKELENLQEPEQQKLPLESLLKVVEQPIPLVEKEQLPLEEENSPIPVVKVELPPTPPHLNTPKLTPKRVVPPHVQQLAKMAKISPEALDQFLEQHPKLADLAKRVSRMPLATEHSNVINSQLFLAVQRATAQDPSLKELLLAAQTLK